MELVTKKGKFGINYIITVSLYNHLPHSIAIELEGRVAHDDLGQFIDQLKEDINTLDIAATRLLPNQAPEADSV